MQDAWIKKTNGVGHEKDVKLAMSPANLFDGIGDTSALYETVTEWLESMLKETKTHRDIATDIDYDSRLTAPPPHSDSVRLVAVANGWFPETLDVCVDAGLAFLEEKGTRIAHNESTDHCVTPNPCTTVGAPSSSMKSHLIKKTDCYITSCVGAPEQVKTRDCFFGDATIKGINNALESWSMAAESSDEGAAVYDCGPTYSDASKGVNFLPKSRMNSYSQCEPADTATGKGHVHIGTAEIPYTFMHKVASQVEPAEIILKPIAHGFPKRHTIAFAPENCPHDESVQWKTADEALQGMHEWMCTYALPTRVRRELDGLAQDMHDTLKRAVKDFVHRMGRKGPKSWQTKLLFFHSDILRYSNLAHRKIYFWASKAHVPVESMVAFGSKDKIGLRPYAMALHKWRRQVHLHCGLTRFWENVLKTMQRLQPNPSNPFGRLQDPSSAVEEEPAIGASDPAQDLCKLDRLKLAILSHEKSREVFTTVDVRRWVRNTMALKQVAIAPQIAEALDALHQCGLLSVRDISDSMPRKRKADHLQSGSAEGDESPEKDGQPKAASGRQSKVRAYVKVTGAEIRGNEGAEKERKRLNVSVAAFA